MTNRNLFLEAESNDLVVDSTGQLVLTPNNEAELAQRIQNRLLWYMGEWWLDPNGGVPYYESILKKQPDLNNIRAIFLTQIANVEGVEKVLRLETEFISDERKYKVDFSVLAEEEVIEGTVVV